MEFRNLLLMNGADQDIVKAQMIQNNKIFGNAGFLNNIIRMEGQKDP